MTKILVVDDEQMILTLTKHILSSKYEVYTAGSGAEAVEMFDRVRPDMILSDLLMPEMNGFDMQKIIRDRYNTDVPFMFMTADDNEELEGRGFDLGAADLIHKPFQPAALLERVENISGSVKKTDEPKENGTTDSMTGLLSKTAAQERISQLCRQDSGVLMIIDLDSFRLVNDIYGREAGDTVLKEFARFLRLRVTPQDVAGRIGGDEFVVFLKGKKDVKLLSPLSRMLNDQLSMTARRIMGKDNNIPLGASVGAVLVPQYGTDYQELFRMADKALYTVKRNGKHSFAVYSESTAASHDDEEGYDLKTIDKLLDERAVFDGAFRIGFDAFGMVYHYFMRYIRSYCRSAFKVLFTLRKTGGLNSRSIKETADIFAVIISQPLRKSDIVVQVRDNQFLLLLPDLSEENMMKLIKRLSGLWHDSEYSQGIEIKFTYEAIQTDAGRGERAGDN